MLRAVVVLYVLLLSACSRDLFEHDVFASPDLSGSLRVPLRAFDGDGAEYRLEQLTLELGGPAMLTLTTGAHPEEALVTPLPEGTYSLFVRPGYRITKYTRGAAPTEVAAELVGVNPLHFSVGQVEAATLKLAFAVGGASLTFGASAPVRVTRAP
jgi:hypothetical protein